MKTLTLNYYKRANKTPKPVTALSGKLILSDSNWVLLEVPNAIVYGLYAALDVPGIELPKHKGKLNAHISVMRYEEVEAIGGGDIISERGKTYHFQIGNLKEVKPIGWDGVERVWFVEAFSPELSQLRRSYGLTSLPKKGNKNLKFHITVAIRKARVLQENKVTKTASIKDAVKLFSKHSDEIQGVTNDPALNTNEQSIIPASSGLFNQTYNLFDSQFSQPIKEQPNLPQGYLGPSGVFQESPSGPPVNAVIPKDLDSFTYMSSALPMLGAVRSYQMAAAAQAARTSQAARTAQAARATSSTTSGTQAAGTQPTSRAAMDFTARQAQKAAERQARIDNVWRPSLSPASSTVPKPAPSFGRRVLGGAGQALGFGIASLSLPYLFPGSKETTGFLEQNAQQPDQIQYHPLTGQKMDVSRKDPNLDYMGQRTRRKLDFSDRRKMLLKPYQY